MAVTAYWSPNQAAIKQVVTYTFTAPNSVGNTYIATMNGKTVTYTSISGDTAALVATGLFDLLNVSTSVMPELLEIEFANPSSGKVTATAKTAGTPFANVPGTSAGLVLSTGNGLASGITTANTTANASPSDVNDAQNWLRINDAATPPTRVRQLPQNADDVVVANTDVPMLWSLDQLAAVQFNTYTRWQSFTGTIGLPVNNPGGYIEWRAADFKFVGPQGSVPTGGLQMVLGQGSTGSGPTRERYNVGSQKTTVTALAAGSPADEWGIHFLGVHTDNSFTAQGGVSLGIAMLPGDISSLTSSTADGDATVGIGKGVTWKASSTLTTKGGAVVIGAAPATITADNGTQITFNETDLTWTTVTARGGCNLIFLCGGTVTTLTLETSSTLDKSQDLRALTITSSTIDGDTCSVDDPNNTITWTNATSVKQQVTAGPFKFTGTRTVKVT